jgi:1-acyl-sn-glycerol-3-phosphate acyltransferase
MVLASKAGMAHAQIKIETIGYKVNFPQAMKTCLRFLLRLLFRFRAFNVDALRTPGPVLLVPNHLSWLD